MMPTIASLNVLHSPTSSTIIIHTAELFMSVVYVFVSLGCVVQLSSIA